MGMPVSTAVPSMASTLAPILSSAPASAPSMSGRAMVAVMMAMMTVVSMTMRVVLVSTIRAGGVDVGVGYRRRGRRILVGIIARRGISGGSWDGRFGR